VLGAPSGWTGALCNGCSFFVFGGSGVFLSSFVLIFFLWEYQALLNERGITKVIKIQARYLIC
jgi:hypothetical protein